MTLLKNQLGIIHTLPLLVVVASVGVIAFLLISSTTPLGGLFGILNPKPSSQAAVNTYPSYPAPLRTFYVSPSGNDSNAGTSSSAPWRSFYKAARTLVAGDMAVFADGTYNETLQSNILNSGTGTPGQADFRPIVFKAQNKHKAILFFPDSIRNTYKIGIPAKHNIVVQDFDITQSAIGNDANYSDKLIWSLQGSRNAWILGNKLHTAQTAFKATDNAVSTIVDGNLMYNCIVCLSTFGGDRAIYRNNEIINPLTDGIQTKGGAKSVELYNNYVHTTAGNNMDVAIYMGGGSCGSTCGVADVANAYEGDEVVAYNNLIVAEGGSFGYGGLVMTGCDNCTAQNNIIVGGGTAIRVIRNKGWQVPNGDGTYHTRLVATNNPTFKNNIVMDCSSSLAYTNGSTDTAGDVTGTFTIDRNIFYSASGTCRTPSNTSAANMVVTNNINSDPRFVNKVSDWHLQAGSPAVDSGAAMPTFKGYYGETIDTSKDIDGVTRANPWDIGIYNYPLGGTPTTPAPTVTPTTSPTIPPAGSVKYGFEDGTTQGWQNGGTAGAVAANSTTVAYEGTRSLSLTLSTGQTSWQSAFRVAPADLTGGTTMTAQVYVPTQTNLQATIYYQDGTWQEAVLKTLTPGVWNSLSYTLPSTATAGSFGVRFLPITGTLSGTVYIDAVNYGSAVSTPPPATIAPTPTPTPTPRVTLPPTPAPTTPSCTKPGDTNCDGVVNIQDYNNVVTDFGKTGTNLLGDLDHNGIVNIQDYNIIVSYFGT